MVKKIRLSKTEARNLVIEAQGLNQRLSTIDIINKLSYVQIDTLSVAERAHHHVFHTRSLNYSKTDLDKMMRQKQVFEYWSHAASYLPMSDYQFSLIKKNQFAKKEPHWFPQNKKMNSHVLDRIKSEGPLQSKDFKDTRDRQGTWYDYKPAKIALEQMFMEGKLMIAERRNFQKVYDLPENILPSAIDTTTPSLQEYCEYLIKSTLKAQGLASISEVGYLRKGIKTALNKAMNNLLDTGQISSLSVEEINQEYFTFPNFLNPQIPNDVHILSPFDNLVIQRKRLQALFDFEYQIECYVPEAKRKYGYYVLPVLYKDRFVARFDPKADRKTGVFTVKKIWFEDDFIPDDVFYKKFSDKLSEFAFFCGCDQVNIDKCRPAIYKKAIIKQL